MYKTISLTILFALFCVSATAQKTRTVTVITQPGASVWIDDVKKGQTDEAGKLSMKFVAPGVRKLRVRAFGYREVTQNLLPTQSTVRVALVKSTDEAELMFHEAEKQMLIDRRVAIELYEKAVALRPKFPEAYVAMARAMSDTGDLDGALEAIANARKSRPIYPEASAVEGRIQKSLGEEELAIAAFKRSIREGKGFQPEAHTGLGLLYKERAESFASSGDFEQETENYKIASAELKIALAQLAGTEPVLYELLGVILEKTERFTEAIAIYEEYLRLFPESNEATTFRSYIVQVRKRMAEQ